MLTFPNASRSYNASSDRISFWGHDGAMEIPFFLLGQALFRHLPRAGQGEPAILAAFDAGRSQIYEAASRAYAHGRRSFYVLGPENL